MKLIILGSGYFIPTKDRNSSGYLLEIGGESILLDSGSGTLRQLIRSGHSIWEISKIFYSHFHLDHISDLAPILFTRKYSKPDSCDERELSIFAHPDFNKFIETFENLYGQWINNPDYPYKFHPIMPGEHSFNMFDVSVFKGNHTDQSLMYRFKDKAGKSLIYTGDTGFSDALFEASQNASVLLIECSSSDSNPVDGHMTPSELSTLIHESRPELTLLTHISPETDYETLIDEINVPSGCEIKMAEDFLTIDV